jgi:hypothetical protein
MGPLNLSEIKLYYNVTYTPCARQDHEGTTIEAIHKATIKQQQRMCVIRCQSLVEYPVVMCKPCEAARLLEKL